MQIIQGSTRDNLIYNIYGYTPQNRPHHVQTIQIASRAEWHTLGLALMEPDYVEDLLTDFDRGLANTNGEIRVSLLRILNPCTGWHNATFIIHTSPHRPSIDGHICNFLYHNGDLDHLVIQELFDHSPYTMIEEWTESHILHLLADDVEVGYLIAEVFSNMEGLQSMRFDEQLAMQNGNGQLDEEQIAIPPPPPMENGVTLETLFFAEIATQGNHAQGNDEFDNIIPYWLESEVRIQQLIEIRNGL